MKKILVTVTLLISSSFALANDCCRNENVNKNKNKTIIQVNDYVYFNTGYNNVGINGWVFGRLSQFTHMTKGIYFCEIRDTDSISYPTLRTTCIPGKDLVKGVK